MAKKQKATRPLEENLERVPGLRLRLLGGLSVEWAGKPVDLETGKHRALLAYLAVAGIPQSREKLAGLFWGDWSDRRALRYLSRALWSIARHIPAQPPVLITTPQTVAFNLQCPHWIDVIEFEGIADSGSKISDLPPQSEICNLKSAIDLYRGEFLDGFSLADCPEFEVWVVVERARLRNLASEILTRLIAEAVAWGRAGYAAGIAHARRLLELEPWREETHRQLMHLLARSGQRSAALAQYAICRRVLRAELSVAPSAETTGLSERLRAAEGMPAPDLPPQPTPFVGRVAELAEIARLVAHPDCRLLTLVGSGGIGKTRLALQAAKEALPEFLHGVFFVPLAALGSPEPLVSTIADALHFSFSGRADPKAQLLGYLREKEMLLIMDNFEHLLDGVTLVTEILQHAPDVKILATSRERLNSQWERVFEVEGLDLPKDEGGRMKDETASISSFSAVQLFDQTARRVQPHFSFEDEVSSIVRVCQLVEGMPLAIEIAAAWVRAMPCRDIGGEIARGLDFLQSPLRDAPAKHRNLRVVFDHSWRLLSEEERRAFKRLSVFRGGFSAEAAGTVISDQLAVDSQQRSPVTDYCSLFTDHVLTALVDKSLLRRSPAGRYDMHELVRQYAQEQLAALPEEHARAHDRHGAYYAEFLQQREKPMRSAEQKETWDAVAREIENIRAGWRWAVSQEKQSEIGAMLEGLYVFYERQAWLQEGELTFSHAIEALRAAGRGTDLLVARLLARQGWFAARRGLYQHARTLLGESLAISRDHDAKAEMAFALCGLGRIAYEWDAGADARQLYAASLKIYGEIGDQYGQALALNGLGVVAEIEDPTEAERFYQESIAIFQKIGDRRGLLTPLSNLCETAMRKGEYAQAQGRIHAALEICEEIGHRWGIGLLKGDLGLIKYACGEYAEAKSCCDESLAIFREIGARKAIGNIVADLARVAEVLGDESQARQLYQESVAVFREIGYRAGLAWSLPGLARLTFRARDEEQARALYQEGLALRGHVGDSWIEADLMVGLGEVAIALGESAASREHYRAALTLAWGTSAVSLALDALAGAGTLLTNEGAPEHAAELLGLVLAHRASNAPTRAKAQCLLSKLERQLPADVFAAAIARGSAMRLDQAAEEILR